MVEQVMARHINSPYAETQRWTPRDGEPERSECTVLFIDDEEFVRKSLSRYLERVGYRVIQEDSGESGMKSFDSKRPSVVLVDLKMPGMSGLDVLKTLNKTSPETPVVMISGESMLQDAINALRLGAWDFITKPIKDLALLKYAIEKVLERANLLKENREYREYLEREVKSRTEELRRELRQRKSAQDHLNRSLQKLERMTDGTIEAFGRMAEMRDPYTAGHQRRVAKLALGIGRHIGLDDDRCRAIQVASLLHDIGKIKIPAELLNKPGRLTDIELELIRTHPMGGYEVLSTVDFPWPVADIVLQHHESHDGTGYPQGLSGDSIHVESRVIKVADTVEAMSSHRPYRAALGREAALEEIRAGRGRLYAPDVVDVCLSVFRDEMFQFDDEHT